MKRLFSIVLVGFMTAGALGQDTPIFELPVPVAPGNNQFVPIASYDGINFDRGNYIAKSEETGLYPSWGWTGEYYETGVTHGSVETMYDPIFLGNSSRRSPLDSSNGLTSTSGTVVPEPSSLCYLVLFGFEVIRRSRR